MKFKINQKGNFVLLEVEQIVEAYGWNDSKTCIVEYIDYKTDEFGTTHEFKKSVFVHESIKSVIHKIKKERARKELELNDKQKWVFQRWKAKV